MQNIPWGKIQALEDEIKALKSLGKKSSVKKSSRSKKSPIEDILKDAFKGIEVTEEDFKEAEIKLDMNHILFQKHNHKLSSARKK